MQHPRSRQQAGKNFDGEGGKDRPQSLPRHQSHKHHGEPHQARGTPSLSAKGHMGGHAP